METIASDLADLSAFAVLLECGSFTRAAEKLGCSKGQLSKRISALEQALGATLVHRTTRRLSLTAAGAALLPEAQALNAQAARARQAVLALQEEAQGKVRLSVPVSLGETFFDAWLMEFSRQYPDIRLELDLSNERRDLVADGFAVAIRSGSLAVDERLARHGVPEVPADLAGHSCLQNTHYQDSDVWLYQRHHELFRVTVGGLLASNHYTLLKKAALAGAGVSRLPSYMIQRELAEGSLVWLLRDYQTRTQPVFLIHPYQSRLPRRTQLLADYLLRWFERSRMQLVALEG